MRTTNSPSIRVPGTVGNFAGAMGCGALALDASMNVKVTLRLDGKVAVRYFGEDGERVPRDHTNLVVRAMQSLFSGPLAKSCSAFPDLLRSEELVVVPITLLMLVVGIAPQFIFNIFNATVVQMARLLA